MLLQVCLLSNSRIKNDPLLLPRTEGIESFWSMLKRA